MGRMTVVLLFDLKEEFKKLLEVFNGQPVVANIMVMPSGYTGVLPLKCRKIETPPQSADFMNELINEIDTPHVLFVQPVTGLHLGPRSLERLVEAAETTKAGMVYSDYQETEKGKVREHPVNDYQLGSIREDFDFGPLMLFSTAAIRSVCEEIDAPAASPSALYDLRLRVSEGHLLFHVRESLYQIEGRENKDDTHFAYLDPRNQTAQREFEEIAMAHLKRIGAHLEPVFAELPSSGLPFPVEASVIIPVRNRVRTIADAVQSALSQETDFSFNVLVVDNHSTDGTGEILAGLAGRNRALRHIVPDRHDLNIGGCWNEAVFSDSCGRFAVQLDSDDLYSSPRSLQKIVDLLKGGKYAMVVGSYTLVNAKLEDIPPGLIDHREWTDTNGRNNALRINGLGAPRAFHTEVLRRFGFLNVSYGEDYAIALRLARDYRIGRIYESLYLCRRWEGNSDAALDIEKKNRYDAFKDQIRTLEIMARQELNKKRIYASFSGSAKTSLAGLSLDLLERQKADWPQLRAGYEALNALMERRVADGNFSAVLQCNPRRIGSTAADVNPATIKTRPCFLCRQNLPSGQQAILYRRKYLILCNPFPIFSRHFTISHMEHLPQLLSAALPSFLQLAKDLHPDLALLYNGPESGASAPDHLHFQAVPRTAIPVLNDGESGRTMVMKKGGVILFKALNEERPAIIAEGRDKGELTVFIRRVIKVMKDILSSPGEPMMNLFCSYEEGKWRVMVFPRKKHRPDAYYKSGAEQILISPGAVDMGGLLVLPRMEDFQRLDAASLRDIFREVSLPAKTIDEIAAAI